MAILFGLAAALCWGGTDFLGGAAARKLGVRRSLFFSQAIGFAGLLAARPTEFRLPPLSLWLLVSAIGLLSLCGFGALALGALTGAVAVVTVLSTLSGAVTAALGVGLRGERL